MLFLAQAQWRRVSFLKLMGVLIFIQYSNCFMRVISSSVWLLTSSWTILCSRLAVSRGWIMPEDVWQPIAYDYRNSWSNKRRIQQIYYHLQHQHQQQFFYLTILPFRDTYFLANFEPRIWSLLGLQLSFVSGDYCFRGFYFYFRNAGYCFLYLGMELGFSRETVDSQSFDFSISSHALLNSVSRLSPVLADTSINFPSANFSCSLTSSSSTHLSPLRSLLFPTTKVVTSSPRCSLMQSIQLLRFYLLSRLVMSQTRKMACESRRQPGIKLLNLYCPAVSQSCSLTFFQLMLIFLETKSMPTVGWIVWGVRCGFNRISF